MLQLEIPDFGTLNVEHAVFDYNGTLAKDGIPEKKVIDYLQYLNRILKIHILTADTFNKVKQELDAYEFIIHILQSGNEQQQKLQYIQELGANSVVSFGNGNNDIMMLKQSALGLGVIGAEGLSAKILTAADIIVKDILDGLELISHPLRLKATLRS